MPDLELEATSKASLGFLTEGHFGVVHTLSLSWADAETMDVNWQGLRLCRRWQLAALYNADDTATLKLKGQGKAVPVAAPQQWGNGQSQLHAIPVFEAEWTIDAWGVSFFMQGAKQYGYFVLLPAVNMEIVTVHRPIVAFLKRRREPDD